MVIGGGFLPYSYETLKDLYIQNELIHVFKNVKLKKDPRSENFKGP